MTAAEFDRIFSLRGVTMNFGNVVAIQDVIFEVAPGEIVGLVGDNGGRKVDSREDNERLLLPQSREDGVQG